MKTKQPQSNNNTITESLINAPMDVTDFLVNGFSADGTGRTERNNKSTNTNKTNNSEVESDAEIEFGSIADRPGKTRKKQKSYDTSNINKKTKSTNHSNKIGQQSTTETQNTTATKKIETSVPHKTKCTTSKTNHYNQKHNDDNKKNTQTKSCKNTQESLLTDSNSNKKKCEKNESSQQISEHQNNKPKNESTTKNHNKQKFQTRQTTPDSHITNDNTSENYNDESEFHAEKQLTGIPKCGCVSVIGETNSGKSTLINQLVGTKVAIVSRKVQTTNHRILGIALKDESQIILLDTPGFNTHSSAVNLNKIAWDVFRETEYVMFVCDCAKRDLSYSIELLHKIDAHKKIILVLNKVDLMHKVKLLDIIKMFDDMRPYERVFLVSALNGSGVQDLLKYLSEIVPEGQWRYAQDMTVDMPFGDYVSEITREHLYHRIHKEIPYCSKIKTEKYEQKKNGGIRIFQSIIVSNQQHKIILIGVNGSKIKAIGEAARMELEELLDTKVDLFLRVVVDEKK